MTYRSHLQFAVEAPMTSDDFVRVLDSRYDNANFRRCRIGKIKLKAK